MRLKTFTNYLFLAAAGFIAVSATMNQSGPGAGYTNAPGEANCTQSGCHAGSLNTSGTNYNKIYLSSNFTGGGYIPDSTYTITISAKHTGINKWGFQVTPLLSSNNDPAGAISVSSSRVQRYTRVFSGKTREYAGHTNSGTSSVATDSTAWVFTWKAPSSNVGKIKFYVALNSANNDANTSGDAIYAKVFEISPSSLLPSAIAFTNDSVTCTGYDIQFAGSGTNSPTSYIWSFPGGTPNSSNAQNPIIKYTTPGLKNAILVVRNSKGTSFPDTFKVAVGASPTSNILGPPTLTICDGDSVQVTANNVTNSSYSWNPTGKTTRTIFISQAGQYRVTTTLNSTGCSTISPPVTLVVNPKPTVTSLTNKSGLSNFCSSITDTLLASGNNIDTFVWYLNGVLSGKTTTGSFPISRTSTTTAHVIGKSNKNCSSVASSNLNLTVTAPILAGNLNVTDITTSSFTVKWSKPAGHSGFEYSTDTGKTYLPTQTDSSQTITGLDPNTPYRIFIRTLQAAPCLKGDVSVVGTTAPCSGLTFGIIADTAACIGDTVSITVTDLYKENYSVSFNNVSFDKDTVFRIAPSVSGIVNVRIIDSSNLVCPAIVRNLAYTVTQPIPNTFFYNSDTFICFDEQLEYKIVSGYYNYDFYVNDSIYNSNTNGSYTYSSLTQNDTVYAVGQIGACVVPFKKIRINVGPQPDAGFTFLRNHKTYTFNPDEQGQGTSYEWIIDETINSTDMNPVVTFDSMDRTITVILKVTSPQGCVSSDTIDIDLPNVSGLSTVEKANFNLLPIPFDNILWIENKNEYPVAFSLFDITGRILHSGNSDESSIQIKCEHLPAGVYYVKISHGNSVHVYKAIKQN